MHHKVLRITTLLMICEGNKIRSFLTFPNALLRGLVTVTLLVCNSHSRIAKLCTATAKIFFTIHSSYKTFEQNK